MNTMQNEFHGGWRRSAVLLLAAGVVLAVGVSGLFADGPDYNNPKLRKGGLVPGDSMTTQRQEGWWNKRWKPATPATSATNVAPRPAAMNAKALLDKNSAQAWGGSWSKETGLCEEGFWGRTSKSYTGMPAQIAQQFLTEYRPLFTGLPPEKDPGDITFRMEQFKEDRDYNVIYMKEFYKSVLVHEGGMNIHLDKQGYIIGLWGKMYPIDSLDVTPALDSAAAWDAVRRAIAPDSVCPFEQVPWRAITRDSTRLPNPVRLLVWPGPSPRLVYEVYAHVWVERYYHRPFQFFLDANTGELLETRQMWMERKKPQATLTEDPDRGGTAGPSPVDSSASKLHPFYRSVPIRRVPQEEWDAIKGHGQPGADSVKVPYDTARPNPRPYRPSIEDQRRKEEARARFKIAKGVTTPASWTWFHSAAYISDVDWDGDGFDARAIFEWDADTWESSLVVKAVIYGRDDFGNVVLLRETPYYTIYGAMPDIYWTDVRCPYRSLWDFRLVLVGTAQDTVSTLNYGEAPYNGIPIPQDIQMERIQEDAVFVNTINDPPDHTGGTDTDHDGYAQDIWEIPDGHYSKNK